MPPEVGPGDYEHEPVMLAEIVAAFEPVPTGVVVDADRGRRGTQRRDPRGQA